MNNIKNELIACFKYGWAFWIILLYGSTLSPVIQVYLLTDKSLEMALYISLIHSTTFMLLLLCSIHYWLIKDAKEYDIKLGWVIKTLGIILPFITIPYYIFKRRKQKGILKAVMNFFILYLMVLVIGLAFNHFAFVIYPEIMINQSIVRL